MYIALPFPPFYQYLFTLLISQKLVSLANDYTSKQGTKNTGQEEIQYTVNKGRNFSQLKEEHDEDFVGTYLQTLELHLHLSHL